MAPTGRHALRSMRVEGDLRAAAAVVGGKLGLGAIAGKAEEHRATATAGRSGGPAWRSLGRASIASRRSTVCEMSWEASAESLVVELERLALADLVQQGPRPWRRQAPRGRSPVARTGSAP